MRGAEVRNEPFPGQILDSGGTVVTASVLAPSDKTPTAFREFVVKLHSRCDLACHYCYVYTMSDQRWRERPRTMHRRTMLPTAARICEHARAHRLPAVDVVLHGGEPLLAGHDDIEFCVRSLLAAAGHDVRTNIRLHTNGVPLD